MTPYEAEAIIAAAQEENSNLFKALRVTEADLTAAQAEIESLTQQRDDARALVVRSGYFQSDDDMVKDWGGKANVVINSRTGEPALYDDGGPVCLPCRNGDHSQHQPTLADVCVGCACEVMR